MYEVPGLLMYYSEVAPVIAAADINFAHLSLNLFFSSYELSLLSSASFYLFLFYLTPFSNNTATTIVQ